MALRAAAVVSASVRWGARGGALKAEVARSALRWWFSGSPSGAEGTSRAGQALGRVAKAFAHTVGAVWALLRGFALFAVKPNGASATNIGL